jgi:hypothetical protein
MKKKASIVKEFDPLNQKIIVEERRNSKTPEIF